MGIFMLETHPAVEKHWHTFSTYVSHKVLLSYCVAILSKLVIKFSHILLAPTRKQFAHLLSVLTEQGCASGTPLTCRPIQEGPRSNLVCDIGIPDWYWFLFSSVPPENFQGKHNALKLLHHRFLLHSFQFSIRHRPDIRCCVVWY